jgi:hypothetical protein
MKILDARWRELARGYETVYELEGRLQTEWAAPIERVRRQEYARRLEAWKTGIKKLSPEQAAVQRRYERQLQQWRIQHRKYPPILAEWKAAHATQQRHKETFHRQMMIGLPLILLLVFTVLGIPFAIALGLYLHRGYRRVQAETLALPARPLPPVRPAEPDFSSALGPRPHLEELELPSLSLADDWWQALTGSEGEQKDYGSLGVNLLIDVLKQLPDDYFIFKELLVAPSLDGDVVLFGPTGVWLLECKHLSGTVTCAKGRWQHVKQYYSAGGKLNKETRELSHGPDEQWLREHSGVVETIKRRLPEFEDVLPFIKGGLVFSHPTCKLSIDRTCKSAWGRPETWLSAVRRAPLAPNFDIQRQLVLADALISYAGRLDSASGSSSAVDLARRLALERIGTAKKYVGRK